MVHQGETGRHHSGGLTADDRLERIETVLEKLYEKMDDIKRSMADGATRFATIEMTIDSLTHRIDRLEGARDTVIKMVMGAVGVALLSLIGLKVFA